MTDSQQLLLRRNTSGQVLQHTAQLITAETPIDIDQSTSQSSAVAPADSFRTSRTKRTKLCLPVVAAARKLRAKFGRWTPSGPLFVPAVYGWNPQPAAALRQRAVSCSTPINTPTFPGVAVPPAPPAAAPLRLTPPQQPLLRAGSAERTGRVSTWCRAAELALQALLRLVLRWAGAESSSGPGPVPAGRYIRPLGGPFGRHLPRRVSSPNRSQNKPRPLRDQRKQEAGPAPSLHRQCCIQENSEELMVCRHGGHILNFTF